VKFVANISLLSKTHFCVAFFFLSLNTTNGCKFTIFIPTSFAMELAIQPTPIRLINRGKFKGLCDTRNLKCVKSGRIHGLCNFCEVLPYFELGLRNEVFEISMESPVCSVSSVSSEESFVLIVSALSGSILDFNSSSGLLDSRSYGNFGSYGSFATIGCSCTPSSYSLPTELANQKSGLGLKCRDLDRQLSILLKDISHSMSRHVRKLHSQKFRNQSTVIKTNESEKTSAKFRISPKKSQIYTTNTYTNDENQFEPCSC